MKPMLLSALTVIVIAMSSFTNTGRLTITSTAFTQNGIIPVKYSCEGDEVNPPLHISDMPAGTLSLAVIVHDPDAPGKDGFTHWVAWNIGTDGNIPEGYRAAQQGMNSGEKNGYKGMCPPNGVHHYYFKVYALDTKLNLDHNTDKDMLMRAMTGHILAQGELVGLYRKIREGEVK